MMVFMFIIHLTHGNTNNMKKRTGFILAILLLFDGAVQYGFSAVHHNYITTDIVFGLIMLIGAIGLLIWKWKLVWEGK